MLHIPILRHGEPYKSLDVARVPHHQTRELFVEISQANAGLIRRDLVDQQQAREKLAALSTAELISICARAAEKFANDSLPLDEEMQAPEDYVRQVSATTGMPHVLARQNMEKIRRAIIDEEAGAMVLTTAEMKQATGRNPEAGLPLPEHECARCRGKA